jgi:hypothetical protein
MSKRCPNSVQMKTRMKNLGIPVPDGEIFYLKQMDSNWTWGCPFHCIDMIMKTTYLDIWTDRGLCLRHGHDPPPGPGYLLPVEGP